MVYCLDAAAGEDVWVGLPHVDDGSSLEFILPHSIRMRQSSIGG